MNFNNRISDSGNDTDDGSNGSVLLNGSRNSPKIKSHVPGNQKVLIKSYVDRNESKNCENGNQPKELSKVQQLKQHFEYLSKKEVLNEYHNKSNWWLDNEMDEREPGKSHYKSADFLNIRTPPNSAHESPPAMTASSASTIKINVWPSAQKLNRFFPDKAPSPVPAVPQRSKSMEDNLDGARRQVSIPNSPNLKVSQEVETQDPAEAFNGAIPIVDADISSDSFESSTEDEEEIIRETERVITQRPESTISQGSGKLLNIIKEMLDIEQNYVDNLKLGVENYIHTFEKQINAFDVSKRGQLLGQKTHIFGNLESIYEFHRDEFYPELMKCQEDIKEIAGVFLNYIQNDYFYGYVLFAINRPRSEMICRTNSEFFLNAQKICHDKLGVNSLLLQPIQRLPRYQLLFNEVIKDLTKELTKNLEVGITKQQLKVCCETEKALQRLLDTVNESMSINDIQNCSTIKVLEQGKFRNMREFELNDSKLKRKYRGKVFFFENCIIYTEMMSKERLEYRGHFLREDVGCDFDKRTKITLYNIRPLQDQIELYHPDTNTMTQWYYKITEIIQQSAFREKRRVESLVQSANIIRNSIVDRRTTQISDSIRSSILSSESITSTDSFEIKGTKWDDRKYLEQLRYTEKHYVMLLKSHRAFYIVSKSDVLEDFEKAFDQIVSFHEDIFHPKLLECGDNVEKIFDLFKETLQSPAFFVYHKYAALVCEVEKFLKANTEYFTRKLSAQPDVQSIDNFLFLPLNQIKSYNDFLKRCCNFLPSNQSVRARVAYDLVHSFGKRVQENYELNKVKKSKISINKQNSGLVLYSDLVIAKSNESYRIFVMEKALACCSISEVNGKETYASVLFNYEHKQISIKQSLTSKKCLKIYGKTKFTIEFKTLNRKQLFINNVKVFPVIKFK